MTFKLESNLPKLFLISFIAMFLMIMPVLIPFFELHNLNMAEAYYLQAIFAGTIFILEIPSGYLSDQLGRKNTLVFASLLKGIGFTMLACSNDFLSFAISEVVLGIAISLVSGTKISLIYDSMNAMEDKKEQMKVTGRNQFYSSSGEAIAALITSVAIGFGTSLGSIAYATAVVAWIPFFIYLTVVEPRRKLMDKKKHKENFKYIFRQLFKQSVILNLIILNFMFYSTCTLIAVWMFQKYWSNIGIPITYFGYLWFLTNITVAFSARKAHKIEKMLGSHTLLIIVGLLPIAGYFGMSSTETIVGVLFCFLFQLCRGMYSIILTDALNKRVTGDFRATANSIAQMGTRILYIITGPIAGIAIDRYGIGKTSFGLGIVYTIIFFLVLLPLLKQRKNYMPTRVNSKQ